MYSVGSIILIDHQIFKNDNSHYQIDHCKKRPAVVIAEDDENFYYLTMTSKKKDISYSYNDGKKDQYVRFEYIYNKEIYGAVEVNRLDDNNLLNLLIEFYNYHQDKNEFDFKRIEKNVLKSIKELTIKKEKQKTKRKNKKCIQK